MIEPGCIARRLCAPVNKRNKDTLRHNGTNLADSCTDSIGGTAVACGEALARHDEGSCIGAEVEEELCQDVKSPQTAVILVQVGKANHGEKGRQDEEPQELNTYASDLVNNGDGNQVSRNGTSTDQDKVSDGIAVKDFVDIFRTRPVDSTKYNRVIQIKTVKC